LQAGREVFALVGVYGQSDAEMRNACRLSARWGFTLCAVNLDLSNDTPDKEIHGRNLLLFGHAIRLAKQVGASRIVFGSEPDARYLDSCEPFLQACEEMAGVYGIEFAYPMRRLRSKGEVLREALDAGLPMHCVFSCTGSASRECRNCVTCRRVEDAWREVFGDEFGGLIRSQTIQQTRLWDGADTDALDLRGNFKIIAALMALPTIYSLADGGKIRVHTTGTWGDAVTSACECAAVAGFPRVEAVVERIANDARNAIDFLAADPISNTPQGKQAKEWGYKQALSRIARPRYLGGVLSVPRIQGELLAAAESLGWEVVGAQYALFEQLETHKVRTK
jgi:hypothetical protein